MKALATISFLGVMILLSACGNCPTGLNTSNPSCPNYNPYFGQPPYAQPYGQPYGQPQPYGQMYPYPQQQPMPYYQQPGMMAPYGQPPMGYQLPPIPTPR